MHHLSTNLYEYLRRLLLTGPLLYPQPYRIPGYQPVFLKCHETAAYISNRFGWPWQPGIQFLDLGGKLYPWPHYVNNRDGQLADFSGGAAQPFIGFVPTTEVTLLQPIIDSYTRMLGAFPDVVRQAQTWDDPLAQRLSEEFFLYLKAAAHFPPPKVLPLAIPPAG